MIRLAGLVAVTLVALYGALSIMGAGDPRTARRAPALNAPQPAARDAGGQAPAAGLLPQLAAGAESAPEAESGPEAEVVQAAAQTPEQVQRFPGPPLRPSPEHAGSAAPAVAPPPPGAAGPIRYVTGNRVNMRAGPSTADRVLGALGGGAVVEVLGPTDGDWINIRDAQGRVGYVSGQFLAESPPG